LPFRTTDILVNNIEYRKKISAALTMFSVTKISFEKNEVPGGPFGNSKINQGKNNSAGEN
jgi:hypothetical protein